MLQDMQARVRKGGDVVEQKGKGSITLGRRDIAHIAHGSVKYFLMYVKPPEVVLPSNKNKDPFMRNIMILAALFYFILTPAIYLSSGVVEDDLEDDIWSIVNVPEKKEPPKPDLPKPKPKQEIAKVKPPETPPKPPKPTPKPPKPVPPKQVPKPPKVVEKPKQKQPVAKPTKTLANKRPTPKKPAPQPKAGMVSTGAKKPDKNFRVRFEKILRPDCLVDRKVAVNSVLMVVAVSKVKKKQMSRG